MKVRMFTTSCTPEGCWSPGQMREVKADEAKQLIDGGFAEAIDPGTPLSSARRSGRASKREAGAGDGSEK